MNAEYNQDVAKERLRSSHRGSRRERLSLSDASAISQPGPDDEPFLKALTRGFLQFICSQVRSCFDSIYLPSVLIIFTVSSLEWDL